MRKILMVCSTDCKDAQPVEHRAYIQTDRQVIPVQRAAMHAECTSTNGMADGCIISACSLLIAFFTHGGQTLSRPVLFFTTTLDAVN